MTAADALVRAWEAHMAAEFIAHDVDATMATMSEDPRVVHLPTMTGGVGRDAVRDFYRQVFLPGHPPDTRTTLLSRIVGESALVDQLIYECTHTIAMPWLLPGIAPTGRHLPTASTPNASTSISRRRWHRPVCSMRARCPSSAPIRPVCSAASRCRSTS
jgi:hypothetical protein